MPSAACASIKVSFRYERDAENALDKVSFVAEAGQLTAIVGPSGAGKIQEAIHALTRERTVVLIAHQLSSVVDADKIIVVDKGRVVAQGRHGELLETSPLYGKLWNDHCKTRRWKIAGAAQEGC